VTKGDLTRTIAVSGIAGEVAALKDNINEMIRNLRDTTQKNTEQDWLKTNLARFSQMLQGQRGLGTVSRMILSSWCRWSRRTRASSITSAARTGRPAVSIWRPATRGNPAGLRSSASSRERASSAVRHRAPAHSHHRRAPRVPPDRVRVGRGAAGQPRHAPGALRGAGQGRHRAGLVPRLQRGAPGFLGQLTEIIGIVLNNIAANMRTEALLEQSQTLTKELRLQQES